MKLLAIFREDWCVANHLVGYARQAHNPSRNKPSRIDKRMPFFDDFVVADFHRANFRDAIPGRPAAGSFDIDDDIILLGVKAVVDFADLSWNASVHELPQPRELITPYRIAFRFDLHKRDRTVFREHQIGKAVAHGEEIFAYQTQDGGNALQARAIEKSPQRINPNAIPSEYAVETAPPGCNGPQKVIKRFTRSYRRQLRLDLRREVLDEAPIFQTVREPIKTAVQSPGLEKLIPK